MILREWRGRVPAEKIDEYLEFLKRTGIPDYAATPGHLGTYVAVDRRKNEAEFVLMTLWDSLDSIRAFASDDVRRARYYTDDAGFLLEKPERVRHYEVLKS